MTLWCRVLEVVYAAQLRRGRMSKFQRRGQVCLLYKKGDRKEPGNYRPITLLNVDAKLGPKILAYRLGTVLGDLLPSDQYGFVPGRDIRHAHLRLQALMKLYENEDTVAGAVLLDFAKAFDSVVWDALDMILMHLGLGPVFRRWVRVIFPGTLVSLLFNGSPLSPFELGRGVRQGDPLSPALFVLYVEPLLNLIRTNMHDSGLRCGASSTRHTVLSFADDCTGLLHDLRDTKRLLDLVDSYCAASGMTLNKNKTVVLPFHPWTNEASATCPKLGSKTKWTR
ncbi:Pol Polyprotein [Phytophthora megakarya]|uniref:Pol Polyprotein n=1 Tax=Phytophthora megakarya TaxID=4795 RepID=A0A225VJV9_9STRA|nr:Pol Polyprotein [Phytophthora megakarya]